MTGRDDSTGGAGTSRAGRRRIALLHDYLGNEYTEAIVGEVVAFARESNLDVVCLFGGRLTPEDLRRGRHAVYDLASAESVDGVLVLPAGGMVGTADMAEYCRRYDPLPICSIAVPWEEHSSVVVDNETGFREGIGHLIREHGRRRLSFVRGPELNADARLRFEVYRRVLAEHGLPFDERLVCPGDFQREAGEQAVRRLLNMAVEFDAVVGSNDASAVGAMDELRRRSIAVPARVSVIGFDDVRRSRHADPPLTTVRQRVRDQARVAVGVLAEQLRILEVHQDGVGLRRGVQPTREHAIVETELVVRESCGCRPYVDPPVGTAGHASADGEGIEAIVADKPATVQAMRAAVRGAPDAGWPEALHEGLIAELAGQRSSLLRALDQVIDGFGAAEADVGGLHRVITVLLGAARRHLRGDALRRADRLLHTARIRISGVAERAPARRMLHIEELTRTLVHTSRDLATVGDLASLSAALAANLPLCDVSGYYVCLYEGDDRESARLVVAYSATRPIDLPPKGEVFSSRRLLPERLNQPDCPRAQLVFPLEYGTGYEGYVVFDRGVPDGFVYEALVGQIGSTLRRMLVLETLLKEAKAREAAEGHRLEDEMRIATEIQKGILPRTVHIDGLDIAALMRPAASVGGDYYDVIASPDGCWIGIGDVSGHGLIAGLVMLMLQSVVSGVARRRPGALPSEVLSIVNAVIYENVRARMAQEEHLTLTLLRYERTGRLVGAGAHEVILVCRAEDGRTEYVDIPGTWVGLVPDIREATSDTEFELRAGDLLVLHTDGLTEARNEDGEMFGLERLAATLASARHETAETVRDALVAAVERWTCAREDDMSLLVARQRGPL